MISKPVLEQEIHFIIFLVLGKKFWYFSCTLIDKFVLPQMCTCFSMNIYVLPYDLVEHWSFCLTSSFIITCQRYELCSLKKHLQLG